MYVNSSKRYFFTNYRYDVKDFEQKMIRMYKEVEPLYMQLHAYVRRKLFQKYGEVYYATKYELNIFEHNIREYIIYFNREWHF